MTYAHTVKIKFDFAIRPDFDKEYKQYTINNHYKEFFNYDITVLSETLEGVLYGKFQALFGDKPRTEPKDIFDLVNIINSQKVSDDTIR